MLSLRASTLSISMTALAVFMSFAAESRADTSCNADAECPKGFTCQVTGASGCTSSACAAGEDCPPPPPCDPQVYKSCEPGPCKVDSDCATGMVCYASTETDCSNIATPACAPNEKCPPAPDPTPCTTTTVNTCVPKYDLPCQTATDCGDGFTCEHEQSCACSGGSAAADAGVATSGGGSGSNPRTPVPAPSGSGSADPAPAPTQIPVPDPSPDCTCTTSVTARCEAKSITCTADSTCPSGWTCVTPPQVTPGCAEPAHVIGFDGGTTVPVCDPPPTTPAVSYCMPPYYSIGGGVGFGAPGSAPQTGSSAPTGSAGSPTDPGAGNSGDGTATTGSAGSSGAEHAASDSSAKSDGGCDVAPGRRHTANGAAVFSLLGLLAAVRRRRRVA